MRLSISTSKIVGLLALSFVNPFAGLLFGLNKVLNSKILSKESFFLLIVSLSFFLGYINTTKIISSDTVYYLDWFTHVDRANPIKSILYYRGDYSLNELFFAILSVAFNYLTWGSESGYLLLCTFFIYALQFMAIYYVCKKFEVSSKTTLMLILILAFYNPLFLQSIHGIRQMMASAILMIAISRRVVSGRNNWILILLAFLTHSSVIAYIPIIIFPVIYKRLSLFRAIIISLLFFAIVNSYVTISLLFQSSSLEYLSYTGAKILEASEHNQMDLTLRGFYMYNIPFMAFNILTIISSKEKHGSMTVYSLLYIITFFVVSFNPVSTEVSIRYAFYEFSFFPYIFLALDLTNRKMSNIILPALTGLMTLIFLILLVWDPQFPSVIPMLLEPLPLFW